MAIQGCDVSNWQGSIDWTAVAKSGIAFAICKATEGTNYADPTFAANWAGMQAAGIARAAYHFARPSLNQPEPEAAYFVQHVGPALAVGDAVALDLEDGVGNLAAWVLAWLTTVEKALGFRPLLYSSPSFLAEHGVNTADIAQHGLWLASWGVDTPTVPAPWTFWAVWQWSAQGTVPGIAGNVDLDAFNGTVTQLKAYGLPPPPAPKPPTTDDLEHLHRLIDAQPFDGAALVAYAQAFT